MIFDALLGNRLSGTANPDQWLIDYVRGGSMTSAGEAINEETALTCAAVYAAVKILSEGIASLPVEVFERLPDGGKRPAYDHPMYRVLHDEPNGEQSSYIWRETGQGHLGTYGNFYNEIQRNGRLDPIALWPLSPKPQITKPFRGKDNVLRYEHRPADGPAEILEARDMLHIPGFGFDGLVGKSPISRMKEVIGYNKAAERYASELFANSAAEDGVIRHPAKMSDKAYGRLQKVQAERAEHGKRHRRMILEEGAEFAKTSMNPTEVQMIEARRFGIEEVARAYRISLHLLQEFTEGAASYSSIVELGREFVVFTLMPWIRRWEAEINRKLLDAKHFCKFNVRGFLQADHQARAEYYNKLFACGGITINRILELEDENPIGPEGDTRFVPQNMQPLDKAIKGEGPKNEGRGARGEGPAEKKEEPGEQPEKFAAALAEIRGEYEEVVGRRQDRCELAARQVIVDVVARLMHKEQNATKRAANHPEKFLAWMDEFYTSHQETIAEALHNPFAAMNAALDLSVDVATVAGRFAQEYCQESKRQLLAASECRPAELPEKVSDCVARWPKRICQLDFNQE